VLAATGVSKQATARIAKEGKKVNIVMSALFSTPWNSRQKMVAVVDKFNGCLNSVHMVESHNALCQLYIKHWFL
jgi:dihydrodipicolinate reductase